MTYGRKFLFTFIAGEGGGKSNPDDGDARIKYMEPQKVLGGPWGPLECSGAPGGFSPIKVCDSDTIIILHFRSPRSEKLSKCHKFNKYNI